MSKTLAAYLLLMSCCALIIGAEHVLVPIADRVPLVSAFAGPAYAQIQLSAFAARPGLINFHVGAGILFCAAIPFQLSNALRRRSVRAHRTVGWIFISAAWCTAFSGVLVSLAYPFAGRAGIIPNLVSATAIMVFTLCAVASARRGDIVAHRAWMLRTVAIGTGIALSRVYLPLLVNLAGLPTDQAMAQVFWLGSGTNLLIVELMMRRRQRTPSRAATVGPDPEGQIA
ncbi:DUF2306 domain-containing protein [Xanthomonas axonopodis]